MLLPVVAMRCFCQKRLVKVPTHCCGGGGGDVVVHTHCRGGGGGDLIFL